MYLRVILLSDRLNGINNLMNHSIYIHIPFCKHRCHYCDFNTYAGKEESIPDYVDALIEEIRIVINSIEKIPVHTIYFGGGTPSLIPISLFKKIISVLKSGCLLSKDVEISLEANPGTINLDYLLGLRDLGFNRLSLGVQSTNSQDLFRLDRFHDIEDVLNSMSFARKAGFTNISLDLILGLPWQDLRSWEETLKRALELQPDHLSIYSLIIEPGTVFYNWYQKGKIVLQDQDLEADMYELTMDKLETEGFEHYEISNWARTAPKVDFRSLHNLQYWLNLPYLGFGAGAHGYASDIRTENVKRIDEYITLIQQNGSNLFDFPRSPSTINTTLVDNATKMRDFMLLGLRLVSQGVTQSRFQDDFGLSMRHVFLKEIEELIKQGLIFWADDEQNQLKLTKRGVLLANRVFMAFV